MTTALTHQKVQINSVRALLTQSAVQKQLALVAPRHLTPERITRIAMTSIQRVPRLAECTPESLLGALMTCTQLGLEPDGVSGRAHLIPYGDKCTLILGYKGLKELAERSSKVSHIEPPVVVYANDEYEFERGLQPKLVHRPCQHENRGEMVAVYVVAQLANGVRMFEWMWRSEVESIKSQATANKKSKDSPWFTYFDEMARKTVVRRICKYLPQSSELSRAVALDEQAEAGIPQDLELIDVEIARPPGGGRGDGKPRTLDDVVDRTKAKPPPPQLPSPPAPNVEPPPEPQAAQTKPPAQPPPAADIAATIITDFKELSDNDKAECAEMFGFTLVGECRNFDAATARELHNEIKGRLG